MMRTIQNESIYTDTGHLTRYKRVLWDVNVGQKKQVLKPVHTDQSAPLICAH